MALAETAPVLRVPRPARPPSTRRFFQRYGTLLILLGLCLVFTVIGPWRTAREACNLWQQLGSLSLEKNGQVCTPVFASQVNLLNLVRQVSVIGIVGLGEMLVATLGVLAGLQGATLVFTNAQPITGLKDDFRVIGTGYVGAIPLPIVIYGVIIAAGVVLLGRTSLGRSIYAIGGNEHAARLSGIRVDLAKTAVFVISGLCAALGALILTARLNSGQPNSGQGYELDAIASVVIGGTSLSGGRGTVFGTVAGALLIGVLSNGLVLMNVSPYYQPIIKGAIIVGAVLLDQIGRRRSR